MLIWEIAYLADMQLSEAHLKKVLAKVKKPEVFPDNHIVPGHIDEWVLHEGVEVPKLSSPPPPFAKRPEFNEEDELIALYAQLEENRSLRAATDKAIDRTRIRISDIESRIAELEERREKLTLWELQEIANCLFGWRHLCGRHYFYLRMCWIYESIPGGGKREIRPLYRMWDNWIFRRIEKVMRDCTGLFGGKRRQYGMTFISASDDLYDVTFLASTNFFLSKDKDDIRKYYDRVKFMYDRLMPFIQKPMFRDSGLWKAFEAIRNIEMVKRKFGLLGPDSNDMVAHLRSASQANPSAAAGDTVGKIRADEVGEFDSIRDVLGVAMPMLLQGNSLKRSGPFIGMGTVGKISRVGSEFRKIFDNAGVWDMEQIFITGWMGMEPDELGNEDRRGITEAIQAKVKAYEKAGLLEEALEYRQQHPLDPEDMFAMSSSDKLLPVDLLRKAKKAIQEDPPPYRYGKFIVAQTGVIFEAAPPNISHSIEKRDYHGYNQVTMLEDRIKLPYNNVYVGGVDPVDTKRDEHSESKGKRRKDIHSDLSFTIIKCKAGIGGDKGYPICWYHGRPDDPYEAYEQLALAAIYYGEAQGGNVQFNIEAQRGAALRFYLQTTKIRNVSVADVIATGAGIAMQITKTRREGFAATPQWWTDMITLARRFIKENWWAIKWDRLIDELVDIRERNTDAAVGFLAALQLAEEIGALEEYGYLDEERSSGARAAPLYANDGKQIVPVVRHGTSYLERTIFEKRTKRYGGH